MKIGSSKGVHDRSNVLERQASGVPRELLLLVLTPLLGVLFVLGYHFQQHGTFEGVDPIYLALSAAPFVVGLVIYRKTRRRLAQLASIAEAVQVAAGGPVCDTELLVAEETAGLGLGRAWNSIVRDRLSAKNTQSSNGSLANTDSDRHAVLVMDSLLHSVILTDMSGRVLLANPAAARFMSVDEKSVVGTNIASVLESEALSAFEDVAQGKVQRPNSVYINRNSEESDAAEILQFTAAPIRNNADTLTLVTVQDVTRQQLAEESRHEFLAQATHELRTPLTNIRLYVDEAIEAGDDDAACRAEALNVISHESLRLERIVSELLDISELEAGARSLNEGDVRMEQLLLDLQSDYDALASDKGVSLKFEFPPKIPVLHGDRDKIAATIHNLIGNAIKYTPEGGTVIVRVDDEERTLKIAVEDTGIGIDSEEQSLVFDKFYRSSDIRIKDIEGTGLGLAFALQVAQKHGGELTLESELNRGSTFTLSMPKPKLAA